MPLDLDQSGRIPQTDKIYLGPSVGWKYIDRPINIEFVMIGGGAPITNGRKGSLIIPTWLVVNNWVLLADQIGSIVVDIWRTTADAWIAGTVPTSANSITGTNLPTITAGVAGNSSALTGWSTIINQNDALEFNVNSCSVIERATLILRCVSILGPS